MSANKKPEFILPGQPRIQKPQQRQFDIPAIQQRLRMARQAPDPASRKLAVALSLEDLDMALRVITVVHGELEQLRHRFRQILGQNHDLATVNAVLLHEAGGEVRVDLEWFKAFEVTGGFEVTEEGDETVIRKVDAPAPEPVPSDNPSKSTEEHQPDDD